MEWTPWRGHQSDHVGRRDSPGGVSVPALAVLGLPRRDGGLDSLHVARGIECYPTGWIFHLGHWPKKRQGLL
jgi:hypothetical protein